MKRELRALIALPLLGCMLHASTVFACPDHAQKNLNLSPVSSSGLQTHQGSFDLAVLTEEANPDDSMSKAEPLVEITIESHPPRPRPISMIGAGIGAGLLGGLVGIGGGIITACLDKRPEESWPLLPREAVYGMVGFVISYPFGSAVGVFTLGETEDETGSFPVTLVSSYVGGGIGLLAVGLGMIPGAPAGATIGFCATRRYRKPEPRLGFLNIRDGNACLSVPTVRSQLDPQDSQTLTHSLSLVTLTF